ncbi:MarR family winged helix-turn-helix transcriptional regulator [Kribbella speibonae]|uniref:MarR family transcriptional regulator n=1 Tax=Kribbella speibonae TaxID=1572660 RepID=A0A4R0IZA3_9ACTN|nr:MarR family transcriptional regulator [Kribbella speibonae]TCC26755.1 MarR family transcriptional regulator [Kribbella speibonae]TCC38819.1 MarR family transcriptional regulator [Kribbella speibonae]
MTSTREELAGEIQQRLIRFIAEVVLYNHSVSAKVGLGASDSQFMTLLQTYGPLTPRQLAEHTGLTSGTVTGVIDRLESHGFVTRRPDPRDRRKVVVTPSMEAIQDKLVPLYAEQGERMHAVLATRSVEELKTISQFLADSVAEADS